MNKTEKKKHCMNDIPLLVSPQIMSALAIHCVSSNLINQILKVLNLSITNTSANQRNVLFSFSTI